MIVLVCGGRRFSDRRWMWSVLDYVHRTHGVDLLVEGGAEGADALAGAWATARGVPVNVYHADWDAYGTNAGPIRNRKMLEVKPDLVLAFPGGPGTRDMCRAARKAGVVVRQAPVRAEIL